MNILNKYILNLNKYILTASFVQAYGFEAFYMVREDDALEYHSSKPAGKISITSSKPCLTQRELSLAYTQGVAVPCMAIYKDPDSVYKYTGEGDLVAVVSNGTAVLV